MKTYYNISYCIYIYIYTSIIYTVYIATIETIIIHIAKRDLQKGIKGFWGAIPGWLTVRTNQSSPLAEVPLNQFS